MNNNDNFKPPCQCVICSDAPTGQPPCREAMKAPYEEKLTITVDSKVAYEELQKITGCSDVTRALLEQLIDRDAHGKAKYGVTLDRTDLNLGDWLQHQAEELMDGAGYALAAKREYERLRRIEEAALAYVEGKTDGAYRQLILALCP